MRNQNVNLEGLWIKRDENRFFWSGRYHNDMNSSDTFDTQFNVLETFDPIVPNCYQDCECLMLGNLMPGIQQKVLDQLQKRPKLIVLDRMNFWMDNFMDDLMVALKNVDVLIISRDEEARQLSGEYSLLAARKILCFGPQFFIIKKGEHGALLFNERGVLFAPALPLEEVVDPTGAGDTFAGGFVGHLCSTKDFSFENMKRAVIIGSAMVSFCVEKFGTQRLEGLTDQEVEKRIQEFIDLVQFDIAFN